MGRSLQRDLSQIVEAIIHLLLRAWDMYYKVMDDVYTLDGIYILDIWTISNISPYLSTNQAKNSY